MPPSDRQSFSFGYFGRNGLKSQSMHAAAVLATGVSEMIPTIGMSGDVEGSWEDDPRCMQIGISASAAAATTGSQYRFGSWMDGSPSWYGFSLNAIARAPIAAVRSISAAARAGSQSGRMIMGISRSGAVPHHSSIIQSL